MLLCGLPPPSPLHSDDRWSAREYLDRWPPPHRLSDARWSAREYLDRWPQPLFPRYFDTLMHPFFASLLPLDADARVEAARRAFPLMRAQVGGKGIFLYCRRR